MKIANHAPWNNVTTNNPAPGILTAHARGKKEKKREMKKKEGEEQRTTTK